MGLGSGWWPVDARPGNGCYGVFIEKKFSQAFGEVYLFNAYKDNGTYVGKYFERYLDDYHRKVYEQHLKEKRLEKLQRIKDGSQMG